MRLLLRLLCGLMLGCAGVHSLADTFELRCEVAYLPSRSTWERTVAVELLDASPSRITIDGVAAYSFVIDGAQLWTAIDNERIVLDMAALSWQSDFRGVATGQGRCSVQTP
jgi:hypothetical protein